MKTFHDGHYYNTNVGTPEHLDNFHYIRMHENEVKQPDIIERILMFQAHYPTFTERTGIDFMDLMCTDPSTLAYIQNTWMELMKPEMSKAMEQEKAMRGLGNLNNILKLLK